MADGITLTGAATEGARQFQGLFTAIPFKTTFEDDSILDGDEFTGDVTVTGAALGDFVLLAPKTDPADLQYNAYVTAADTVTVQVSNMTGGTITAMASGFVMNGVVLKPRASVWDAIAVA